MSKILLISGSPREGNTEHLLRRISEKLKNENEMIYLKDKSIGHCRGCLACHSVDDCIIKDDMTEIRKKMSEAEAIIMATPNYFGNVTGLFKDFVDRLHPFYESEGLKDKRLYLIMIGGSAVERSEEFLAETTKGLIKYLKFNPIGSSCFSALQNDELEKADDLEEKINEIVGIVEK
jgi:multimeric flavodoxin WrbA